MTALYLVIAGLLLMNLALVIVLYRLVTQLTSKIMAKDLGAYTVATAKTRVAAEVTHAPKSDNYVPVDQVPSEEIMQSLAEQTGRLDEFEEI